MARLTADQWKAARIKWESDPSLTFEDIGKDNGVSRVAVSKKAAAEKWERVSDLQTLAKLAHARSDAREVTSKVSSQVTPETIDARDAAVDLRADVLDRHKADLARHRHLHADEAMAADLEAGKRAKISMEVLALRHKAERSAYGLDEASTVASSQNYAGMETLASLMRKHKAAA